MRTLILFFILIIELSIIGHLSTEAFPSESIITEPYQPSGFHEYRDWAQSIYQPTIQKEIAIFAAYVQILNDFDVIDGMKIYHYHIIEIHLVQESEIFEHCKVKRAVACLNNWQIFIINGVQGLRPIDSIGGCSILFHELQHATGLLDDQIAERYPNERCAV